MKNKINISQPVPTQDDIDLLVKYHKKLFISCLVLLVSLVLMDLVYGKFFRIAGHETIEAWITFFGIMTVMLLIRTMFRSSDVMKRNSPIGERNYQLVLELMEKTEYVKITKFLNLIQEQQRDLTRGEFVALTNYRDTEDHRFYRTKFFAAE